ncbi:ABC transporter permease [Edaphobacter albus]|uniref:ABC transporter permease n=1 Tax=Edaphobacter sp. 4G125 TaxID=2763071 RepID=UPI00164484A4|nr:ABC transporter permease [Edaphobacter sp. 4G125]QNI38099.1 ABC transporter permease [Edaphobacter sp. 4G125]
MISWGRRRKQLLEEIEEHIALETQMNLDAGMSPEEAQREAKRKFGNPLTAAEDSREVWGGMGLERLVQDVRYAVRQLRRSPAFALTAITVFALGLFASTAIYAFVDAALVKPLPYRAPSRLVALYEHIPVGDRYHLSYLDYQEWRRRNRVFSSLDVYRPETVTLRNPRGAEEASGALISDGFFHTLGVAPSLGRDFRQGEEEPSATPSVILSYEAWQKRFGSDKGIIGHPTTINGESYVIIGVLPHDFHFAPVGRAEFWIPLRGRCKGNFGCFPYYGIARLKENVSLSAAAENLTAISKELAQEYPKSNRDRTSTIFPLTEAILGNVKPMLITLLSGAALLCLIGFVNVSSLLLVKTEGRRREIAVREALGAPRLRLIRQFFVEGFLLAACGLAVGLTLTFISLGVLKQQIPAHALISMPYLDEMQWNLRIPLFASIIAILGGVLFAAAPIFHLLRLNMQEGLRESGRSSSGRSWRRSGSGLVVVELAITVVLLVSAGLLAKSFYRLLHVDMGIATDQLALLHVVRLGKWDDNVHNIALEREIVSRLSKLPGVESVGVAGEPAVGSGEGFTSRFGHFRVEGRSYVGEGNEAIHQIAGVGYFETLRARLIAGRFFAPTDDGSRPRVAVINQTMAQQEFGGESALGKRIISQYDPEHPFEIVGIVADLKDGPLDMKPTPAVYQPFDQATTGGFYVGFRTSQPAGVVLPSAAKALRQLDPALIVNGEETMSDRISNSEATYLHKSAAWVVGGFAGMALLLGTLGLYGVISYSVTQRRREIGVRVALGAQRSAVYSLVMREALRLSVTGIAGGLLCSFAATMLLRSLLFGVTRWDGETFLAVMCVLLVSSLLASYLPASRAAKVDPMVALRTE